MKENNFLSSEAAEDFFATLGSSNQAQTAGEYQQFQHEDYQPSTGSQNVFEEPASLAQEKVSVNTASSNKQNKGNLRYSQPTATAEKGSLNLQNYRDVLI